MGLNKQRLASVSDAFLMRYGCEVTIPRDSSLSPRSRLPGPSTALFKSIASAGAHHPRYSEHQHTIYEYQYQYGLSVLFRGNLALNY